MDEYTSHELAYQNGYAEGHEKGYKEGFLRGLEDGKPKWIPVTERLPMYNVDVLVYRPKMAMKVLVSSYEGYYGEDDNEWHEGWARYDKGLGGNSVITHWMPLPEPPKGE